MPEENNNEEQKTKRVRKVIKRGDDTVVVTKGANNLNGHAPIIEGAKVKIIPLGGMCEIGKNTWVIEYLSLIHI